MIPGETKLEVKDGEYVLSSSHSKKARITSIAQWNEIILVFKRVRCFYHPQFSAYFDMYQTEINRLANTYTALVWLDYDKQFRQMWSRDCRLPVE